MFLEVAKIANLNREDGYCKKKKENGLVRKEKRLGWIKRNHFISRFQIIIQRSLKSKRLGHLDVEEQDACFWSTILSSSKVILNVDCDPRER